MEKKNDIWMPLFVGDYLADTMHLTTEQHGAYLLLLMAYWKAQGPLPDDNFRLASITKLSPDAWSMNRAMLEEFFDMESIPGWWAHGRVEKELQKAKEQRQRAIERGKAGAAVRWGT